MRTSTLLMNMSPATLLIPLLIPPTLWLSLCSLADGEGLQLVGDYYIAGLFPLHNTDAGVSGQPYLRDCKEGLSNKHGYHLLQAMRFAVEEINNNTSLNLLPGVTLGYQTYDTCSRSASTLATLDLLIQQSNGTQPGQRAVAVVGPDSSSYSFTPAAALGAYLVPQISYEASNEMLSNKVLYPAFFRTIPSDKKQVNAMIQILVKFNWTWVAILGSDNEYGLQGMQSLSEQASDYGICVAYQGVIPGYSKDTKEHMRDIVQNIIKTKVNTIVVFSSKRIVSGFFPFVIEQNVTDKVWIGTEDWSVVTLVSAIPGIQSIGTVLGVSLKYSPLSGFSDFEKRSLLMLNNSQGLNAKETLSVSCLQDTDLLTMASQNYPLLSYDIISSFNVYKAVYAIAHALHKTLGCNTGGCQHTEVEPWEVWKMLKTVRFSVRNTSVYFDENGDPPTSYDIVAWVWVGEQWTLHVVGDYSPDPPALWIDSTQVPWRTGGTVPTSVCSPQCPEGHRKLLTGQHKCCFDCMACPAGTFLNKTGTTNCQDCELDQWSVAKSEECLARTVMYLPWEHPLGIALLLLLAVTLLLTLGTALVFLLHLGTPVVKSAGGKMCLVMLLSLTVAASSALCHFGHPSKLGCLLKQPLFVCGITVCLSCITVRALQVVCIFKWSSKLPRSYETWSKSHGPEALIGMVSASVLLISVLRIVLDPSLPVYDHDFYFDKTVEECSKTMSAGAFAEMVYVVILSVLCFCLSYMGKDLPANYNEAKCVTFCLMMYMVSWVSFITFYSINREIYAVAMHVGVILVSVLGILGGYFLPKVYIILIKPQMNTTAHFQNCIQMYTMTKQ
ncbi:taste receptor type 1 member 1 [Alosa sapidissima]|uniref:taste receptor type 1 member 1 n=1 Tax=Alosa sapidissima TaxID=34773 RepID=UPI001C0941FA|nr:taste receptor type 1 member 1 [Alosa sapidissima]